MAVFLLVIGTYGIFNLRPITLVETDDPPKREKPYFSAFNATQASEFCLYLKNERPPGGAISGSGCDPSTGDWCGNISKWVEEAKKEHPDEPVYAQRAVLLHQPYYHFIDNLFQSNGWLIFEYRGEGPIILPALAGWLGAALVLAMLTWLIPYSSLVDSPLWVNVKFIGDGPSLRQLAMGFWLLGLSVLSGAYLYNHARINNLVSVIGRSFGGALIPLFCFQLIPILKDSIMPRLLFGASFERALVFHRLMGYSTWALMTAHFIALFIGYVQAYERNCGSRGFGFAVKYMLKWDNGWPHGPPLAALLCWILFTILLGCTFIRRKRWELFVFSHMLWPFIYMLAIIHYPTIILFLAIPVLLHFADFFVQRWNSVFRIEQIMYYERAGITAVHCIAPYPNWRAPIGGYMFVSFAGPGLSPQIQSHPFSVASSEPGVCSFYIKDMGPGTWTHKVGGNTEDGTLVKGTQMWASGPYGKASIPVTTCQTLILIAGGIGVTPILALLGKILNLELEFEHPVKIVFVWVVRSTSALDPFVNSVTHHANADWPHEFSQHIYATSSTRPQKYPYHVQKEMSAEGLHPAKRRRNQNESSSLLANAGDENDPEDPASASQVYVLSGRPDWNEIFESEFVPNGSSTSLFTCGPGPLVASVEKVARERQFNFHKEVFLF